MQQPDHRDTGFWTDKLAAQGWCIIPDALPAEQIAALDADLAQPFEETPFCQGAFYGETTKRFGRLLTRSPHVDQLVRHPLMLAIAQSLLLPACDAIQLNVAQAIGIHPGAPAQAPHRDEDMWPCEKGGQEYLLNILWPLTPFTQDNGATLVWPGSHGRQKDSRPPAEPVIARMPPGAALLILGSTLHGAGANRSDAVRRGIVIGYSLGWLRPYENPSLAYPPHEAKMFAPELAALCGYRQHRPNLGNFEGQCPSILLQSTGEGPLGAMDSLRPDQAEMVAAFAAAQD